MLEVVFELVVSAINVSRRFILRASNSSAAERLMVDKKKKVKAPTRRIVKLIGLHFKNGDAISTKVLPIV
jgi:hypothetical protein